MTETPDPNPPTDRPPHQPLAEPHRLSGNQPVDSPPTDAVTAATSATSVTAAPDPPPAEAAAPGADGPEVEVETTDAATAHIVANPSPIPDYAMEPPIQRPAAEAGSDTADPAANRRYLVDAGLTVPFTPEPTHPLAPEPTHPLAPVTAYPVAPVPGHPAASVRPRRRPLFGTIAWGIILLALAGYVLLGVLVPAPADPTLWLLGGVVVIGLLLIVVGVIAALRRAD